MLEPSSEKLSDLLLLAAVPLDRDFLLKHVYIRVEQIRYKEVKTKQKLKKYNTYHNAYVGISSIKAEQS